MSFLQKTMEHFKTTRTKSVLNVKITDMTHGGMDALLTSNPSARFVHVEHEGLPPEGNNLIELARKHELAKETVVSLANHGFMAYILRGSVTSFVHYQRLGTLWKKVTEGTFKIDENGLVYSFDEPLSGHPIRQILVVFSAMAKKIYTANMMRHFEQNFASIQKYVPAGTAVLRIADLGGVVGGYYMNTHALPDNERHIQELIKRITYQTGVNRKHVAFYGVSKGGTAALYHGLLGGYRVVAVDPILADEHYIKTWKDSHFTVGVFPKDKREKFEELSAKINPANVVPTAIVCSEKSPQFPYITQVLGKALNDRIAFFNSAHPEIKVHPDVGPKTVNLAVMLINSMMYGVPPFPGKYRVDDLEHGPILEANAILAAGALTTTDAEVTRNEEDQGTCEETKLFAQASSILKLKPPTSEAGKVEYRGRLTTLENQLKEYLQINPGHPVASYHLARLLDKLGHHQDAVTSWKTLHEHAVAALDIASFGLGSASSKIGDIENANELMSTISSQFKDVAKLKKARRDIENRLSIDGAMEDTEAALNSIDIGANRNEGYRLLASALRKSRLSYCEDERIARMLNNAYDVACRFSECRVDSDPTSNLLQYKALQRPVTVRRDGASVICTAGFSWSGSGAVTDMLSGYQDVSLGLGGRELSIFRFYTDILGIFDRGGFSGREFLYLLVGPVLGITVDKRQLSLRRNRSLFKAHVDAGGDKSGLIQVCEDLISTLGHAAEVANESERARRALAALRAFCNGAIESIRVNDKKFTLLNNIILGVHIRQFALFDDVVAIAVKRDPRDQYVSQVYDKPRFAMQSVEKFISGVRGGRNQFEKAMNGLKLEDRVIEINFEDFVLDSSVRERLVGELRIDSAKRTDAAAFDPAASSKNIGIYKKFADQEAIHKIERELPDLLYP